ncbi:hypothetical protein VNO77_16163 [Canavalia gladiata]|uniref:Uncharacterized protein n=1 Tax=Canavalia gladiata TaxID=3824 RepID=A0AAN9QWC6_CANGL
MTPATTQQLASPCTQQSAFDVRTLTVIIRYKSDVIGKVNLHTIAKSLHHLTDNFTHLLNTTESQSSSSQASQIPFQTLNANPTKYPLINQPPRISQILHHLEEEEEEEKEKQQQIKRVAQISTTTTMIGVSSHTK